MEGVLTVFATSLFGGFVGGAIVVTIIARELSNEMMCCIREVKQLREELATYRRLYKT